MDRDGFLASCVFVDIEMTRRDRIGQIGAVCGDAVFQRKCRSRPDRALAELDRFVADVDARFVAGHYLLRHDLRLMRATAPNLKVLDLPAVDSLFLSPLAFPEHPYHSLVKDYKLVKDALNDPVADARLSCKLLGDEWDALAADGLDSQPSGDEINGSDWAELLSLYRYCFAGEVTDCVGMLPTDGMVQLLEMLGAAPIDAAAAKRVFDRLASKRACCAFDVTPYLAGPDRIAVAYCAAWLPVAGGNSVLPQWVRYQFPQVVPILKGLRDQPCNSPTCEYCRRTHDSAAQLQRYFGFSDFRPLPAAEDGSSLQEAIVRLGMGDQPHLAILPTGGGKSLCYQLPALVRNQRRGVLTIVLSPLQALMKDQVDNLVARTGCNAAALSGMLTPPERGQVLEQVRLGDVSILYISPEQLRNKSTVDAIVQREIGCWVFDEAHCLSKWGHDFRPDYLYASRFIRELADRHGGTIPSVTCFTATAKRDVADEIVAHFREELGQALPLLDGGVERDNLDFEVQTITTPEKFARVHTLLSERMDDRGSAVVYTATRKTAERLAEYLVQQNWSAAAFHAGLPAPDKRRIQDEFIGGDIRVICATNAFGMGIDKDDVRMVVHADMPGSLENYLQEAGRAGRDRENAKCVLLYGEDDVETQFALGAISQLTPRDITQILRGLRRSKRKGELLVITSGELLRDEDVDTSFESQDNMADTKVKTAVAWLERAGFLQRNHNATFTFQGNPRVRNLTEAEARIAGQSLSPIQRRQWLEIIQALMNTDGPEGLNADQLAELPSFRAAQGRNAGDGPSVDTSCQRVLRVLDEMARAGLVERGTLLSAYVRYKVADSSRDRLGRVARLESALLRLMQELEPDADEGNWLPLTLRTLNQRLTDDGETSSPEVIRSLLVSLSLDGKGFAGNRASIDFRHSRGDHYRVKLRRSWSSLIELSEKRRQVADVVLQTILGHIPSAAPAAADHLVEFSCEDLTQAVQSDLVLASQVKDTLAAVERGLMYLHEQRAIILQHGLSVFRQAMTIRLRPEAKGRRYAKGDFEPLDQHYKAQALQVHVMCEYARRGAQSIKDGLKMVMAYFSLPQEDFVSQYFADRQEMLDRPIDSVAYARIVDDLRHPVQQAVVSGADGENALILAGPGSGKTRAIVHRVAYLVQVRRVRPSSVLVLCFNRMAAIQLKRRLRDLLGKSAGYVTVMTYHALAVRLTGVSLAGAAERPHDAKLELAELIPLATRILRGEQAVAGLESDEARDRLLAGYRFVLIDEYQDIDEPQYDLISALTARGSADPESTLAILAVGDDDQNIYTFRGTNVAFIRRFREDYAASVHYLLDNYRSTANIIAAANHLIAGNRDRMKLEQPIRINASRADEPPGGAWQALDPVVQGRVQILQSAGGAQEAGALAGELLRIRQLAQEFHWSSCAVLARTREALHPVRSVLEYFEIPVLWGLQSDRTPPLHRIREMANLLDDLRERREQIATASELVESLADPGCSDNPWHRLVASLLEAWRDETGDGPLPVEQLIQYVYEVLAEQRREQRVGAGVFMSTVHAAKGTEFDHVFIPNMGWGKPLGQQAEEERRLYYVAMTRARHTVCLLDDANARNPFARDLNGDFSVRRTVASTEDIPEEVLQRRYELLSLEDVHLGFAGTRHPKHPTHQGLADLQPGARLRMRTRRDRCDLIDALGRPVARLSQAAYQRWKDRLAQVREIRVVALVRRERKDEPPEYRDRCRVDCWEVPLVEIVYNNHSTTASSAAFV